MTRRYHKPATGEPTACGLCGKAVIYGLTIGGKPANQAMTTAGIGRIHVDKRVCKALEKVTYEELERPERAALSAAQVGGHDHDAVSDPLHPVGSVGLDQAGNGG